MELLNDFSTSVEKAFDEIDPKWRNYDGLVICGSWPGENVKEEFYKATEKLKKAKEKGIPVLGICFGRQVIGFEQGKRIDRLPQRRVGIHEVEGWWGKTYETFWHDFYVNDDSPDFIKYENPYVVGVQFHPEYQSWKQEPHPVLKEFLEVCKSGNVE